VEIHRAVARRHEAGSDVMLLAGIGLTRQIGAKSRAYLEVRLANIFSECFYREGVALSTRQDYKNAVMKFRRT